MSASATIALPGFLIPAGPLNIDKTDTPATKTAPLHYGRGPVVALGPLQGRLIQLTLGITAVLEQQSLDLTIHGSSDGESWPNEALLVWPQKFYTGTSAILIDLRERPDILYLQARWLMTRWGRGDMRPRFDTYLFADVIDV